MFLKKISSFEARPGYISGILGAHVVAQVMTIQFVEELSGRRKRFRRRYLKGAAEVLGSEYF